jgi:alpha-1,3-rhamnosyl/mannosyltransferase
MSGRRLRIGIDAGLACSPRPTGVQHFAHSILEALLALETPGVEWRLYVPPGGTLGFRVPDTAAVRSRPLKSKTPWLIGQTWADRLDVLYTPGHSLPAACRGRTVVTVHDLIFDQYPDSYPPDAVARFRTGVAAACRRATRVITPSDVVRHELATQYRFPADRIDAIGEGYRGIFRPSPPRPLPQRLVDAGLGTPYLLAVGRLNRRKNLGRVVDAYRSLLRRGATDAALLIVGPDHFGVEELRVHLEEGQVPGERIIVGGYVTDEELAAIYQHAAALVYASLAEGFGLPLLEAMASGTPVITSNVSPMTDVAGGAALLVDPLHAEAIGEAMEQVLTRPDLAQRLTAAGHERVKAFSWRVSAERLRDSLLAAAAQPRP